MHVSSKPHYFKFTHPQLSHIKKGFNFSIIAHYFCNLPRNWLSYACYASRILILSCNIRVIAQTPKNIMILRYALSHQTLS